MKYTKIGGLALLLAALAVAASAPSSSVFGQDKQPDKKGHVHGKGPNGGVVFDFGKFHGEFTVNHDKKECTVFVLGEDEKTPVPVAAKDMVVSTKATKTAKGMDVPAMTIKMLPKDEKDGKATKFVGTDPGLGNVADFEGTVAAEIDGKGSLGRFKEEPD